MIHIANVCLVLMFVTSIINGVNGQACCCSEDSEIEIPGGDFEVAPPPAPGAWIDYGTGAFLGP